MAHHLTIGRRTLLNHKQQLAQCVTWPEGVCTSEGESLTQDFRKCKLENMNIRHFKYF